MESPYYAPPHLDAAAAAAAAASLSSSSSSSSRPSIGFPLGAALLLIIIFSLSGVFSCCYHWDKLRSLRQSSHAHPDPDVEAHHHPDASPSNPNSTHISLKQNQSESLPVLMPGDKIPKFIALPCPCEPPRLAKIIVHVQKPPKPPRIAVPLC
ncbi:hypothetical protein ACSBR2_009746 [Camellia fascicularis]